MSWNGERGKITLRGDEAHVFRTAIMRVLEGIMDTHDDFGFTVDGSSTVINALSKTQQAVSIREVAKGLFVDRMLAIHLLPGVRQRLLQ